jgi:signal transduction histidine kinase
MNLISNGMEAIEGKGDIYIQLDRVHLDSQPKNFDKWRAGDYVELKVRDTGIGIATEYQERIFEPFSPIK